MPGNRTVMTLAALACLVVQSACVGLLGPVDLELAVGASSGALLTRSMGFNVLHGPLAGVVASEDEDAARTLSSISSADVGVYTMHSFGSARLRELELAGWERIMRVREHDSDVVIFARTDGEAIKGMVVIARDHDDLVIARVMGRVDKIIEECMSTRGKHFGGMEPDCDEDKDAG